MRMPDTARRWTRDEVLALPRDGNQYELLDGELLVTPSPSLVHQRAIRELFLRLHPFVARHGLGELVFSPADVDLRSGQFLQPDLFVVQPSGVAPAAHWSDFRIPLLVVEVLSPSTAFTDRNRKRTRFLESGVAEYWVVDTDARRIERWRPGGQRAEILAERLEWQPDRTLPAHVIALPEYFRDVWREG